MEAVYIIAGFIIIVLFFVFKQSKPLVVNVSSDEEIADLAGKNKIEAIKEYRALHGVGLREAKDAVERMMSTEKVIENEEDQLSKIKELIVQGQTIAAIKEYRALYGVGLREAKEAVEAML